jgi:allantoin racemase
MRIKYIVPFAFGPEGLSARAAGLPRELLAADTEVDVVAVRESIDPHVPETGRSAYEALIIEVYVTEAGLRAEDEGYDAVVIDTVSDSGLYPLRSRLSIPVVGPGAVAYAVAMLLGKRFSIVTYREVDRHFSERNIDTYRLWDRCASIRAAGIEPDFERLVAADREEELARLTAAARKAVEDDGADTIVLGSTTMYGAARHLRARLETPVVNPGPVAVKIAETLVQLGLSHSKLAFPPPALVQDEKLRSLADGDRA